MDIPQTSLENTDMNHITKDTNEMAIETHSNNDAINTETSAAIEGQSSLEGSIILDSDSQSQETLPEFIDFEELIDLTRDPNEIEKTIRNIKEFESVLSSFETPKGCVNEVEDIINLDDDFSDILENYKDSNDLDKLIPNTQSDEAVPSSSNSDNTLENIVSNFNDLQKLETPKSEEIDNPDSKIPTKKDAISKVHEQDQIYVISDEETRSLSSDGYNSSDFEFITETEAKMDGFIIDYKRNAKKKVEGKESTDELESSQSDECRKYASQIINENRNTYDRREENNAIIAENGSSSPIKNFIDPGEGPSGLNGPINDYSDRSYRENHILPEDEGYLELFQGEYDPVLPVSDILLLENKSIKPSPMNSRYEGIGFDKLIIWRNCLPEDSSEEEYGEEAKDSLNKILSMYPDENRKPRRRRRH